MPAPAVTKLLNAGWFVLERGVNVLIGIFVMVLVARHLGPERLGAYAYLFGLTALLMPLAQFGLETIVMRRSVSEPEHAQMTLGSAMSLQATGALIAATLAVGFVALAGGPAGATPMLALLAALTLIAQPWESLNAWLKARERMARVVLPRIAVAICVAGLAVMLLLREASLGAFVALRGVEAAGLALAATLAYATTRDAPGRPHVARLEIRRLLREGLPLALSAVTVALYMRLDQVMLGQLADADELGQYSVAVRLAEIGFVVAMALRTSMFAGMVRAFDRDAAGFDGHAQRLYDAMALASLATLLIGAVGCALLLEPIFGADYAPALPITFVLLLSLPWVFLGVARGVVLVVRGWFWTAPVVTALGALLNGALNLMLIPDYGGLGAAWASVASYAVAGYGSCLVLPRLRPIGKGMTRALNPIAAADRLWRIHRTEGRL